MEIICNKHKKTVTTPLIHTMADKGTLLSHFLTKANSGMLQNNNTGITDGASSYLLNGPLKAIFKRRCPCHLPEIRSPAHKQ